MLISQGDARGLDADRRLACTLAVVAGALNAAAFQAVGFFSANMTGNVSSLSARLASGGLGSGAFYLAIVLIFIAGAACSTLLINLGRRRKIHAIYAYSILAEAILMGLLSCATVWLPSTTQGPVLVLGLSFLMGLQNAVVTRISEARVRTTHVSGMITDIGIELAMLFDIVRGRETDADRSAQSSRLRLHAQTVAAFLAGGVAGVIIYRMVGGLLLAGAAAGLFVIALSGIIRLQRLQDIVASD